MSSERDRITRLPDDTVTVVQRPIEEEAVKLVAAVTDLIQQSGREVQMMHADDGRPFPPTAREAITADMAALVESTAKVIWSVAMLGYPSPPEFTSEEAS